MVIDLYSVFVCWVFYKVVGYLIENRLVRLLILIARVRPFPARV